MNDHKQVQKALDAVSIDIWTNWKKNMFKKVHQYKNTGLKT